MNSFNAYDLGEEEYAMGNYKTALSYFEEMCSHAGAWPNVYGKQYNVLV